MRADEAMARRPLVTIDGDETLEKAARLMLEHGVRHLPVVDEGRLVGVLSERDLLSFRGYGGLQAPVSTAMTKEPVTATPEESIAEVAKRMAARKLGCLPIVENERILGIITTTDLLSFHVGRGDVARAQMRPLEGAARDLMTHDPLSIHFDDSLLDAVARMSRRGIRHLPVVDGDSRPIGMLSDRDVRRALGGIAAREGEADVNRRVTEYRVGDVATLPAMTIEERTSLNTVARRFVDDRIGALAVVDDAGRLSGVISYIDILERLLDEMHSPSGVAAIPPEPMMPVH